MDVQILHTLGACSSLILFNLPYKITIHETREIFLKQLKETIKKNEPKNPPQLVDYFGHKYHFRQFSFCLLSTNEYNLPLLPTLEELGFTSIPEAYNSKNSTVVRLHTIPVANLLEKLKEYPEFA